MPRLAHQDPRWAGTGKLPPGTGKSCVGLESAGEAVLDPSRWHSGGCTSTQGVHLKEGTHGGCLVSCLLGGSTWQCHQRHRAQLCLPLPSWVPMLCSGGTR